MNSVSALSYRDLQAELKELGESARGCVDSEERMERRFVRVLFERGVLQRHRSMVIANALALLTLLSSLWRHGFFVTSVISPTD